MTDYTQVKDALASGADPAMLCTTCPWDRNCVIPPTMTSADIEAKITQATAEDEAKAESARTMGREAQMPVGLLMTAVIYGGKDTSAQVCPVFVLRLRSSAGRQIADAIRSSMQGWDDAS